MSAVDRKLAAALYINLLLLWRNKIKVRSLKEISIFEVKLSYILDDVVK
jgi:hypothetical protein